MLVLPTVGNIHIPDNPHTLVGTDVCETLDVDLQGLSQAVVLQRQHRYGKNALPVAGAVHPLKIFLRQFLNPLIYIL